MQYFTQLTQEQRYHIFGLRQAGNSQSTIADSVGVHKSTISRELARNHGERGYRPKQANEAAVKRRHKAQKRVKGIAT